MRIPLFRFVYIRYLSIGALIFAVNTYTTIISDKK